MNPINMLKGMMGISNPKDMAMKMLSQNNNPIFKNLIDMANKGDTKGAQYFARYQMKSEGKDFDQEFNKFKSMFNSK